jgi:hypothetical protein
MLSNFSNGANGKNQLLQREKIRCYGRRSGEWTVFLLDYNCLIICLDSGGIEMLWNKKIHHDAFIKSLCFWSFISFWSYCLQTLEDGCSSSIGLWIVELIR